MPKLYTHAFPEYTRRQKQENKISMNKVTNVKLLSLFLFSDAITYYLLTYLPIQVA